MIKFNPENKQSLTIRESLAPAMDITSQEEADQYLIDYVEFIKKVLDKAESEGQEVNRMDPKEMALVNLGYYAGYENSETRERVERLFGCRHPIFGSVKENGIPEPWEAFECGKQRMTLKQLRENNKKS